jgi:hypothetical protein
MMNIAKSGRPRLVFRRGWRASVAVLAYVLIAPALALAHGGMGPEEIGPPIASAGLLGFVSYWVVMWWPSTSKKTELDTKARKQNSSLPQPHRRAPKHGARVKRVRHLRKVEMGGQLPSDQPARRKASDG